ncbi:Uma2 family endonuclease [Dyadobacter jiangsuensis]|uniref:Uma2 family endonuclease n=1 Tax=Dyadobacter jiangsuensis TaxID=1591085 RepID=A0A2P8FWJ6_9BACT|nr:Uma2 family endonuclease [Dyadobacter jiangsuensis]PSL26100.1 Uma2 family endonuclease [Dyadobacter jiangsuensis]
MPSIVTDINELDLSQSYTYADYLLWHFKERVELIKGKIFKMSPAPSTRHQQISAKLHLRIGGYFENHYCHAFFAPFDVRLPRKDQNAADQKIHTVVQPDLCVICDESKLDERGCLGAPDLIVEVLSPGNSKTEMHNKFELYQESGVREYWLVEPSQNAVLVYVLDETGKYVGLQPAVEFVQSSIFPELKIDLGKIFS